MFLKLPGVLRCEGVADLESGRGIKGLQSKQTQERKMRSVVNQDAGVSVLWGWIGTSAG